ncbi:MAG: methyltransferase domain-containing protein [Candidatus Methanomethylophilaceae archaeon]|nr:methyltransferase domain-containing protein [Candidatus Methanomethylophilaceae archaeon]
MAFQENETVYLEDGNGKRIWFRISYGMIKVPSMGAIDGSRFKDLEEGDVVSIVGREYTIFRPGVVELMTSLDRGAQVIIPKDAATILLHCDVKCGDRVLEVGAGSGGLTTALLHAVASEGRVHTLELKEENAVRAGKNVARAGLDRYWSYSIGDAREMDVPDDGYDVLTMDMPDPWLALDNLEPHLRSGGRICAYIPNANQLDSTVRALRDRGYASVQAMENMQRAMEVHPGGVRPSFDMLGHTGYLVFARKRSGNRV